MGANSKIEWTDDTDNPIVVEGAVVDNYGFKTLDKKGGNLDEWPEELRVREFPALEKFAA